MNKLLYILLLLCFAAHSQTQLFTIEDGLSNKNITSILQTRNGYMWVGTENGLNLYNGYTFTEFNRHNGLSNGKITCLYEDRKDLLWIGTWQGLNILNQRTGEIKKLFGGENKNNGILNSVVRCIDAYPDGSVLIVLGDGTLVKFRNGSSYTKVFDLPKPANLYKLQVLQMKISKDSSVYMLTNYGDIIKLDKHFAVSKKFKISNPDLLAFGLHSNHKVLITTGVFGNIDYISAETGKSFRQSVISKQKPGDLLTEAYIPNEKFMWTGYSEGSLVYTDLVSGKVTDYTRETKHLITGATTFIYPDRSGVYWIGSNYGLIKFCPKGHAFENYLFVKDGIYRDKNSMRGLMEDKKGDLYMGSYNGLFRMRAGDTSIHHFIFPGSGRGKFNAFFPYRLLDDDNYIWITSETQGFYRFNKNTEALDFPVKDLGFFRGYALLPLNADTLLIGTHHGLFIYDKKRNTMKKRKNPRDLFDISTVELTVLERDARGNIWIGSYSSGLFKMEQGRIVKHFSEEKTGMPLNFITSLYAENDSTLWLGTRGGGLGRINTRSEKINFYNKSNGLADNSVAAILKDNSGTFWISTFNGLSKFNVAAAIFENYYDKDGLTDNEFNVASFLKARDGKIYFGGLNGVNGFYPQRLTKRQRQPPKIFLTHFTKYDGNANKLIERSIDLRDLEQINFTHTDKFFSFSFALDDYYNPLRNTFFYQLEGYDHGWTNTGTQNNIRFNSLPAGNYKLRIKGVNSEGSPSVNEMTVDISVSPAFYSTWWFYAIVFMATIAGVYMITRYRIYQGLKINKLRTKISSDLHDEVGSLLTRISIQAELIKQGISPNDTFKEVSKIADTSRLATAAMSDVLWSIDARNDKMGNLIDRLREQAGEILFPLDIAVDFKISNIDPEKDIDNITRQNIFLIFKEAINNIARHAQATSVNIVLENRQQQFVMSIEDNGLKKQAASTRQGQGLRNMKMRADLMEGQLEIINNNGYKITLTIKKI